MSPASSLRLVNTAEAPVVVTVSTVVPSEALAVTVYVTTSSSSPVNRAGVQVTSAPFSPPTAVRSVTAAGAVPVVLVVPVVSSVTSTVNFFKDV